MQRDYQSSIVFIENLTFLRWIFSIWPNLTGQKNVSIYKVYYVDATALGLAVAKLIGKTKNIFIEPLDFRMLDIRDQDDNLIRLRICYQDMAGVLKDIMKDPAFQSILSAQETKDNRIGTVLKKQAIAYAWNASNNSWRLIFLVHVASWKAKKESKENVHKILFASPRLWMKELTKYASAYNVTLVSSGWRIAKPKEILCRLFGEQKLKSLYYHFLKHGFKGLFKKQEQPSGLGLNRLMVEYNGHLNLDRPEMFSDLFFWQTSDLKSEDLLLTFNLPGLPADEDIYREVKQNGITALALNPKAVKTHNIPFCNHWNFRPRQTWPDRVLKDQPASNIKDWLKEQIKNYYQQRDYWLDLLYRNGVKLYVSWYKHDIRHCIIADALTNLGGATAIYQRSWEEFPLVEAIMAPDIAFGYSQYGIQKETLSQSIIPYYVVTGFLGDHRFPLLKSKAAQTRDDLHKKGVKRIVAFLDESSGDDSRWHTGHNIVRESYSFLLKKVMDEPWFGLVLKPKVPSSLRKRLGPVAGLLKEAEETGRCTILEEGALHNDYPPCVAAMAADVAIHGNLCCVTAGLEMALTGTPTLMFDAEGWPSSPLYQLGIGRVVFTEWAHLWKMCLQQWNSKIGVPGFGDWSDLINEYDQFRDGRAAERMGTYLNWLLEGFKEGLPRETVLADTAERYQKVWGKDKVQSVNCAAPKFKEVIKSDVDVKESLTSNI